MGETKVDSDDFSFFISYPSMGDKMGASKIKMKKKEVDRKYLRTPFHTASSPPLSLYKPPPCDPRKRIFGRHFTVAEKTKILPTPICLVLRRFRRAEPTDQPPARDPSHGNDGTHGTGGVRKGIKAVGLTICILQTSFGISDIPVSFFPITQGSGYIFLLIHCL